MRRNDLENISLIEVWKIGLFVNTRTAHYKYPVTDCENLLFPIQIQLSEKQKRLYQFFIPFVESPSNFEHFQKKEDRHS